MLYRSHLTERKPAKLTVRCIEKKQDFSYFFKHSNKKISGEKIDICFQNCIIKDLSFFDCDFSESSFYDVFFINVRFYECLIPKINQEQCKFINCVLFFEQLNQHKYISSYFED